MNLSAKNYFFEENKKKKLYIKFISIRYTIFKK
jgi:hypothetical protein